MVFTQFLPNTAKHTGPITSGNLIDKGINGILLPKLFWPTVRKNCSTDQEKLLKFEAEGREFAIFFRSLEQFVQKVKGQINFWWQKVFLTCSWKFLRYDKLEKLEFKLKKIIGI